VFFARNENETAAAGVIVRKCNSPETDMRWIRRTTVLAAMTVATIALPAALTTPAHADPYKWCAEYGAFGNEAENCGFVTYQQCLATISGIGGFCQRNPRYTGPERRPRRSHHRHRRNDYRRY
jgi:hypothetical protein